jgi:TPR repeat protein
MEKIVYLIINVQIILFSLSFAYAETAYDLYMSGNKQEALVLWKEKADAGDASSKYIVGMLYNDAAQLGLCSIEDLCLFKKFSNYRKAKQIFEELFEEDDPRAAYALGEFYDDHPLIFTNYKKAASFYLFAAKKGVPEAQYNIANMYERGEGVEKDLVQSVRWYLQCNKSSLCGAGEEGIDDLISQLSVDEFQLAKSLVRDDMKDVDIRITVGR